MSAPDRNDSAAPDEKRIRLLLVDDDLMMRRIAGQKLASNEHIEIVAEAKNGTEAVQLALEHAPDMVVMDVDMPFMNGLEATRRILREMPDTKVLMFSGTTTQACVDEAFAAGARAFVSKTSVRDLEYAARVVSAGRVFVSG
jgi:DNA-binding NarL/FixJ family response regulator